MNRIEISLTKKKGLKNWYLRRRMPKADRIMIFTISQCAKKEIEYTRFRCELSLINKTLLEQGIDMKLPRYWGLVGEYPEWNTIMERVEKWGYYFNMKQIASHYPVLKDKPSGVNPQAGHDGTMEG